MASKLIAQNGDRLDQIVYQEYETLSVFDKVLEENTHLIKKIVLDYGDIVNLPVLEIQKATTVEIETLW